MPDVIHIGYAKSASTFLQNSFKAHPAIEFFDSRPIVRPLLYDDDNVFDREAIGRLGTGAAAGGNVTLLSDEALCGWSNYFQYSRIARRRGAAAEFKFSPEIREEIRQHFAASNSNLEALLGVGIAQYGYTTA